MNTDSIVNIKIDAKGRVCVTPKSAQFPLIYREAMEVTWDSEVKCLVAPPDPSRVDLASPDWWFTQILSAAEEQGWNLNIALTTIFENIPDHLRTALKSASLRVASFKPAPDIVSGVPMASENRSAANRAFAEAKHLFHEGNFAEFVRLVQEHEPFLAENQKHFLETARKRIAM